MTSVALDHAGDEVGVRKLTGGGEGQIEDAAAVVALRVAPHEIERLLRRTQIGRECLRDGAQTAAHEIQFGIKGVVKIEDDAPDWRGAFHTDLESGCEDPELRPVQFYAAPLRGLEGHVQTG